MKKVWIAMAALACFALAGCVTQNSAQVPQVVRAVESVPGAPANGGMTLADSYVVDGFYSVVLTNISDKLYECGRSGMHDSSFLSTGKGEAYLAIADDSGNVFVKVDIMPQGDRTSVIVYAQPEAPLRAAALEVVKSGAQKLPGCPGTK